MTLNVNLLLFRQSYAYWDEMALKLRGFRYKLVIYLIHLHIKFDDEIRRESLHISSIVSY